MTLQASQGEAETSSPSPSPSPPSQAEQASSDFKERVRAGLEKAGARKSTDDILDSDVAGEETPPPPPKAGKPSRAPSAERTTSAAAAADPGTSPAGGKTAEEQERTPPQPRYDSRSFSKWIENNPDKAAELGAKVFKVQLGGNVEAWKKNFIASENKRRRQNEQDEKDRAQIDHDRAEVERIAKEAREPIEDIIGIIEAEQKEDYPAIDRFIETTFKCSFNDYCARRLRAGAKETPTERALKQKDAAQQKKIAELEAKLNGGAPAETPAKTPAVSERWLERELPESHGVRDLSDWKAKVTEAYEASKDDDSGDYGLSIEEAADQVLAAFLEKRTARPPARASNGSSNGKRPTPREQPREPARRPARERAAKVWTDDDEDAERTPAGDLDDEGPPEDFHARQRWAMDRAARRR